MKVTIEIDATPQEMRTLMGLPDIEDLQQEMLEKIREKMMSAIEANDMTEMMKLLMPNSEQFKSMESLQATFWQAFSKDLNLFGTSKKEK